MDTKRIVVGITGATGAVFGLRLLDALSEAGIETHLVVSRWGQQTVEHECGVDLAGLRARASVFHGTGNMAATISSGSFHTDGMVIAPCSMRTAAAIAHGVAVLSRRIGLRRTRSKDCLRHLLWERSTNC